MVLLNKLKNADISPLIEMFREIDSSDIDAVDIIHRAPCCLKKEEIMSLMHAINQKLQLVDLGQMALTNDILRFVLFLPSIIFCSFVILIFSCIYHSYCVL